jgi:rhodanese-related sulfurtransferase
MKALLKNFRNGCLAVSLGLFVNCKANSLESMAQKYSFFEGVAVVHSEKILADKKVVFIDVRPQEEREIAMIKGSLSVDEFEQLEHFKNSQKVQYVAYCTIGHRSGKFAQKMQEKGLQVSNLYGGILDWVTQGGEVVDAQGLKTLKVHVYGSSWNFLPPKYQAIW